MSETKHNATTGKRCTLTHLNRNWPSNALFAAVADAMLSNSISAMYISALVKMMMRKTEPYGLKA
jgi:hypothetical protein